MSDRFLRLNGVSYQNRYEVFTRAKEAISDFGGWILDFQLFSNLSANIRFEIEWANLMGFIEAIESAGITLNQESHNSVLAIKDQQTLGLNGSLQILFIHSQSDLLREVPAFG